MFPRLSPSSLAEIEARNICIVKPSALGDVVQALPMLHALRMRFPKSRISWVIKRELADLLVGHPALDELIAADVRGGLASWRRLLVDLHRRRFDLVFDLQGLLRTAVMTLATGAPVRVGLQTAREGSRWSCNCMIPGTSRSVPAHARYRRVIEALGIGGEPLSAGLCPDDEHMRWARRQLAPRDGLLLGVHAGAQWVTKQWPVDKFAAIASGAIRRYQASVLLLGAPAEQELGGRLEAAIRSRGGGDRVRDLTGQTSLRQLAALLAEVDLLLTNDSGPMHLADALGTPVVGVFTCTSPRLSGPPGSSHQLASTRVDCAASYKKRCPQKGSRALACLDELSVDRVWQAFERAVHKNGFARSAA